MRGGGYCTATLIAPDLVLSAAHCTFSEDGTRLAPNALTFRAGFRDGTAEAERRVVQIARPEAYSYKGGDRVKRIANDVVLLRLEKPIPTHIISPFKVEQRKMSSGEVSVVSYGRGRASRPSLQYTCAILQASRGVMLMNCDTTFGSSGAPVFRREGTRTRIASVVSGYAMINGVRRTTGMELPAHVQNLKKKMIAEAPRAVGSVKRIGAGTRAETGAKFIRP
jgi:protease YdgD